MPWCKNIWMKKYIRTYGEIKKKENHLKEIVMRRHYCNSRFSRAISFHCPYNIIRECAYSCNNGNAVNDIYPGLVLQHHYVALGRIFELSDCTQGHHLKEDKDTHGKKNSEQIYHRLYFYCQCYAICNRRKKRAWEKCVELCWLPYQSVIPLKGPRLDQQH